MIYSRDNSYLFVQLPRTGCTAVARELVKNYAGERILAKHSPFHEFAQSKHHDPGVFVFSSIRNPLDDLVSVYEKLRTNHERYLEPERHDSQPDGYVSDKMIAEFRFVSSGAGFDQYLRRHHRLPYDNWASLSHASFDRVMRFESLADDLASTLKQIGLEPKRPLPSRNSTTGKASWMTYYEDPDLQEFIAPLVYPFMHRWGYEFPAGWRTGSSARLQAGEAAFRALRLRRKRIWARPAPRFEDGK